MYFNWKTTHVSVQWLIYHFHSKISDTTLDHQECAASPCALATLLFAISYFKDPSDLTLRTLPKKVYKQVVDAIHQAIRMYQKTYNTKPVTPLPREVCELVEEVEVVTDEVIEQMPEEMLQHYVATLKTDQVLMVYTEIPYKVFSIINCSGGEKVLIFDSQKQDFKVHTYFDGGYLICVTKDKNFKTILYLTGLFVKTLGSCANKCKVTIAKIL